MSAETTDPGASPTDLANRRILVVDDNPRIHDDFRTILVRSDDSDDYLAGLEAELFGEAVPEKGPDARFEVDSAHQGHEGLDRVKQALAEGRPYAVAFVDVRMPPGWDGVETIKRLWEVDPALQVVICTAYSDYSWEETVDLLDPAEQFLILKKPFDTVVVRQLAHALTAKWTREKRARAHLADLENRVSDRARDLDRARHLLEREQDERRKVETLLRHAWSLDRDAGQALREPLVDLEDLMAHFRRLAETRGAQGSAQDDPEVEALLAELPAVVERASGGLSRMAETLRALGGLEPGEPPPEAARTDLDRAVARVLADTPEPGRRVRVTCDYAGDTAVACRESDVRAVLLELLDNAFEAAASAQDPAVRVRTWRDGAVVGLEVVDNGAGVPVDLRERIFEPWFSTRHQAGNGLATVRDVLARVGGDVTYGEAPAGGASFVARWPAADSVTG